MACFKSLVPVALLVYCYGGYITNAFDIPEQCKDITLCEYKPSIYDSLQDDINDKFLPIQKKWNLNSDDDEFSNLDRPDSELNCLSENKVIKPYTVIINGTAMAVVQTNSYEQLFRTTECVSWEDYALRDGDQCFEELTTGTSKGHCKTKHTTITLYAYNDENNRIQRVPAELPVYCSCSITS